MTRVKIKKDKENPESVELLAKSIIQVADGFEKILQSSFHDSEFERYVDEVRPRIAEPTQQLMVIIER